MNFVICASAVRVFAHSRYYFSIMSIIVLSAATRDAAAEACLSFTDSPHHSVSGYYKSRLFIVYHWENPLEYYTFLFLRVFNTRGDSQGQRPRVQRESRVLLTRVKRVKLWCSCYRHWQPSLFRTSPSSSYTQHTAGPVLKPVRFGMRGDCKISSFELIFLIRLTAVNIGITGPDMRSIGDIPSQIRRWKQSS